MEIESLKLYHGDECTEEMSEKPLLSQDSPDLSDIFAEPPLIPRVGEDYQVEIPPMRTELLMNPLEAEAMDNTLLIGLPIPITWIHEKASSVEGKRKRKSSDIGRVEEHRENKNCGKNYVRTKRKRSAQNNGDKDIEDKMLNKNQHNKEKYAVPGFSSDPWSDSEAESFVLGLYIFGKNFISIERFIENRKMSDILSYYYGVFYRSDAYSRWSARQKTGSRKCIRGRKIFTGWRQQELLSRLLPHVSEESQKTLLKGSVLFSDGKTSLEEYVLSLTSIVGLKMLMEAIGIGKGKEDLTAFSTEHGKNNHALPGLPKMPSGKACSSLTCTDIVNFLTGGFRLSKARCNDIFWEAVWPRLLARGWHSEQPKNQSYVSSKHCLVFLIPGVKKFSRRKLVKGEHYFDSVSDVLSKIALEPDLLKLEAEYNENGRVQEVNSDPDDMSDHLHHSYLKPRVPSTNSNSMKFTIVDTSLIQRGQPSTVRELKCLPVSFKANLERSKDSKNIEMVGPVKDSKRIEFMIVDTSLDHGGKSSKVREMRCSPHRTTFKLSGYTKPKEGDAYSDMNLNQEDDVNDEDSRMDKGEVNSTKEEEITSKSKLSDMNLKLEDNMSDDKCHENKEEVKSVKEEAATKMENSLVQNLKKTIKQQFHRRVKSSHLDSSGKRRRLSACTTANRNCTTKCLSDAYAYKKAELDNIALSLSLLRIDPLQEESSISLDKDSAEEKIDESSCSKMDKAELKTEIDLNVPQISGKNLSMDEETSGKSYAGKHGRDVEASEQCSNIPRRQSTRNRPLTMRALEAFANGFLYVEKKQTREEIHSNKIQHAGSLRKPRSRVKVSSKNGGLNGQILQSKEEKEKEDAIAVTTISNSFDQI